MACGYNLRGLPSGGLCPECGEPIARSLEGKPLSLDDPIWSRNLFFGILCCGLATAQYAGSLFGLHRILLYRVGFLGSTDIWNLAWIIPWLAAGVLFRYSTRPIKEYPGPARFLFWVVVAHLSLDMLIPAIRHVDLNWTAAITTLAYRFTSLFWLVEIWLLLRVFAAATLRIPRYPMRQEIKWFGEIFLTVLTIDWLLATFTRLYQVFFFHPSRFSNQIIPGLMGQIVSDLTWCAAFVLLPLWIYFPVLLVRFALHVRRASQPLSN